MIHVQFMSMTIPTKALGFKARFKLITFHFTSFIILHKLNYVKYVNTLSSGCFSLTFGT